MGLNSGAFYAFSKQAQLVALSSCHAELQALDEVIRIVIHLITILQFMQIQMTEPVQLNCVLCSKLHIRLVLSMLE